MSRGRMFEDFLYAIRSFESGVDYERYQSGQITELQIRKWVGEENWSAYKAGQLTWVELQYRSVNDLGFVGYQFGEQLLIDLGYYSADGYYGNGASTNTWDGRFTGKNGIKSLEDLKTNLQEKVLLDAFGYNLNVIQNGLKHSGSSLNEFIGKTFHYKDVDGSSVSVEMSVTGILAASHLRGAWGTLALLQGGVASADEYGTSILKYISKFGGYESPSLEELISDYVVGSDQASVGGKGAGFSLAWAWGANEVIEGFDPAEDRISFADKFGAGDINISETNGNVVIEVLYDGTAEQSYTLKGVMLSNLSVSNFVNVSGSYDFISKALGNSGSSVAIIGSAGSQDAGDSDEHSGVRPAVNETKNYEKTSTASPFGSMPELDAAPNSTDHGDANSDGITNASTPLGGGGKIVTVTWSWGSNQVINDLNPSTDIISFGWMLPHNLEISEDAAGSLVVSIPSNNQSFTFQGVSLSDLSMSNIQALDPSLISFFDELVGSAGSVHADSEDRSNGSDADDSHDNGEMGSSDATASTRNDGGHTAVEEQNGSGLSGGSASTFTGGGQTYAANPSGADIVGFDPSTDQLDFGSISVHGLILTQTADGEASIRNVWNNEEQILKGVSIADLTVESLGVVGNEHLRQDLGGILSWEHGIGPRNANTVYILSHQVGKVTTIIDFNPATDKISFLYYGTRERLTVDQNGGDLVISNQTTDQTFIIKNLSLRDLTADQLEFHFDQVMEDNLERPFGVAQEDVSLASREGLLTPDSGGQSTDGSQVREGSTIPVEHDPNGEASVPDHSQHDNGEMGSSDATASTRNDGGHTAVEEQNGSGLSGGSASTFTGGGQTYAANPSGADIVGFDPSTDQLDFGSISVHGLILTQTADGEASIRNVWNNEEQILKGVSIADLTVESLGVVGNEHLRQDLGGILSWEHGIGPRNANTVYILSHQVGKVTTIIDFNPATDKISFLYYGTRERLTVDQNGGDLVISNQTTDQTFIFKNLSLRDLTADQLEFHFDQVMEDNLERPFGVAQEDVSLASREGLLTPDSGGQSTDGSQVREGSTIPVEHDPNGEASVPDHSQHDNGEMGSSDATSSTTGFKTEGHYASRDMASPSEGQDSGDVPSAESKAEKGKIHRIAWDWGERDEFHFNPTSDTVDFGWMSADSFELSHTQDGLLIEIVGNEQSYLLVGADTPDLSPDNFLTLDAYARQEVFDFFS